MERLSLVIYTLGIALILHNSVWIGSWHGMVVSAKGSDNATNQDNNGTVSDGNATVPASGGPGSNDTTNGTSSGTETGTGSGTGPKGGNDTQSDVTTTPPPTTTEEATTEAATTEPATTETTTTEKSGNGDNTKTTQVKTNVKSTGVKKEVIIGLSAGFGFGLLLCIFLVVIWNCCCNKLCSDGAAKIMPVDLRNTDTAVH